MCHEMNILRSISFPFILIIKGIVSRDEYFKVYIFFPFILIIKGIMSRDEYFKVYIFSFYSDR